MLNLLQNEPLLTGKIETSFKDDSKYKCLLIKETFGVAGESFKEF